MFKERLISGIVMVIILIATVGYGGNVLFAVVGIVSLIGMSELYKVFKVENKALGVTGYLAAIAYYAMLLLEKTEWMIPLTLLFLILVMAVYVFTYPIFTAEQVMAVFFGFFYVSVMLSYVYQTRMLAEGAVLVWLIFLSSCVGVLFGKHKMAPKLSPKKSIEGGVGGVLGAALLGALFALAVNQWAGVTVNPLQYALICGVGGMISQIGDLAASGIKRNHGIKDYGKLIPGHGGILDRFDSVIITAPIIYYLSMILGGTL